MDTGYACKACAAPASVDARGVHRTCACNTTVVACMSAVATGDGTLSEGISPTALLLRKFHDIGLAILKGLSGNRLQ